MAYKGNPGKINFNIPVNAFQIPDATCFEKLKGSQVKLKLHLCLKEIFIGIRYSWLFYRLK